MKTFSNLTKNPFSVTPFRYAICPACLDVFDPETGSPYASVPDDCAKPLEPIHCADCAQPQLPDPFKSKRIAAAVLAFVILNAAFAGVLVLMNN